MIKIITIVIIIIIAKLKVFFVVVLKSLCRFILSLQIYYKAIRDIEIGEELLVYMKDGVFPEGSMAPNLEGEINASH